MSSPEISIVYIIYQINCAYIALPMHCSNGPDIIELFCMIIDLSIVRYKKCITEMDHFEESYAEIISNG